MGKPAFRHYLVVLFNESSYMIPLFLNSSQLLTTQILKAIRSIFEQTELKFRLHNIIFFLYVIIIPNTKDLVCYLLLEKPQFTEQTKRVLKKSKVKTCSRSKH